MYTREFFIKKSQEVHGFKFDYSLVEYKGSNIEVKIICNNHNEKFIFNQKPVNHLRGRGCIKCSGKEKLNTEIFIKKAKEIHGNKYDYSLVNYKNIEKKVKIICNNHLKPIIFEQTPNKHINVGQGCLECCGSRKQTFEEFLEKANKIYGNEFKYDKSTYTNSKTYINIICSNNHIFKRTPELHLRKKLKCNFCNERKLTKETFIKKSNIIHNNKYDYSLINYINKQIKVKIICNNHGESFIFEQKPKDHCIGRGCPKCSTSISKKEIEWLNKVESKLNRKLIKQYKITTTNYIADGYDPITNTIYEFHGNYFHGNPKKFKLKDINKKLNITFGELYKKTLEKENTIKNLGYNLIVMWESDYES